MLKFYMISERFFERFEAHFGAILDHIWDHLRVKIALRSDLKRKCIFDMILRGILTIFLSRFSMKKCDFMCVLWGFLDIAYFVMSLVFYKF